MHTKHTEPCLLKAKEDEPVWVLRGQDRTTPATIRDWAARAAAAGAPDHKVKQALADAAEIEQWQILNPTRVKVPD
jgi:hypothetical protein